MKKIYCPLAEALGVETTISILDIPDFARENALVPGIRKGMLHTEETKKLMSEKRQGRKPMLGKSHSEETKQRMSESRKRYLETDEGKKTFDKWQESNVWTDNRKEAQRRRTREMNRDPEKIRKTAEKHKGMKRSPEARARMSEARKKYLQSLKNGV